MKLKIIFLRPPRNSKSSTPQQRPLSSISERKERQKVREGNECAHILNYKRAISLYLELSQLHPMTSYQTQNTSYLKTLWFVDLIIFYKIPLLIFYCSVLFFNHWLLVCIVSKIWIHSMNRISLSFNHCFNK
jgi:hypothetical protein